jgi:hypothetical protein
VNAARKWAGILLTEITAARVGADHSIWKYFYNLFLKEPSEWPINHCNQEGTSDEVLGRDAVDTLFHCILRAESD